MATFAGLIVSILPLVLFAAVSPVVFLNSSTATSSGGSRGGWYFTLGNALVLVVLGIAGVGLLGASASTFAEREIASKTVDRFLGIALLLYASYLILQKVRAGKRPETEPDAAPATTRSPHDLISWGALGMVTNFTTLPVFASVAQRIGAANINWLLRFPVLALAIAIILTPAWAPPVIATFNPARGDVSQATRARIAHWTAIASITACVLGGLVLLWTAR